MVAVAAGMMSFAFMFWSKACWSFFGNVVYHCRRQAAIACWKLQLVCTKVQVNKWLRFMQMIKSCTDFYVWVGSKKLKRGTTPTRETLCKHIFVSFFLNYLKNLQMTAPLYLHHQFFKLFEEICLTCCQPKMTLIYGGVTIHFNRIEE